MRPSTGTWSASLLPPMKLYLGNPAHLAAGAGKDAAKSGAKSKDAEAMLSLSCRTVKPSIATAGRLSQRRLSSPTLPHPRALDPQATLFFARTAARDFDLVQGTSTYCSG